MVICEELMILAVKVEGLERAKGSSGRLESLLAVMRALVIQADGVLTDVAASESLRTRMRSNMLEMFTSVSQESNGLMGVCPGWRAKVSELQYSTHLARQE
jgi:hypothetical protein